MMRRLGNLRNVSRRGVWYGRLIDQAALVSVAFLTVLAVAFRADPAQAQATPVVVEEVEIVEIADTTPVIASLVGTLESDVATRRDGIVEDVMFDIGDRIEAGQALARLDDELVRIEMANAEAALASAKAGVAVAEARVRRSEQAFKRQSDLRGTPSFSRGQFEDLQEDVAEALSEVSRARAEVARSEAALQRAIYDSQHSVITAPFTGVAISRDVHPGQYVTLGGSVGMLLDLSGLEVLADIPVELIDGVVPGRKLTVSFSNDTSAVATVRTLVPVETVSTRTRPVRLTISLEGLPDALVASGKSLTVQVPISAVREAILVPKDALVQGLDGNWMVFVAREGKAAPQPITLGQPNEGMMEVLRGLGPGDLVVVRGNERLRPDQPIAPMTKEGKPIEAAKGDADGNAANRS